MADTTITTRRSRFEVLQGVLPITAAEVPSEIVAGLTLAALAIPEVMGYTKISGTPVITGLYTIFIPTMLFAVFGSSRHLVVGADSATAAILAAALIGLAPAGSDQYVALAAVLAIMAGCFVLLARVIGLGFMADFLSRTVLIGFLTGVGIQVALGEISGMQGLSGGGQSTFGPPGPASFAVEALSCCLTTNGYSPETVGCSNSSGVSMTLRWPRSRSSISGGGKRGRQTSAGASVARLLINKRRLVFSQYASWGWSENWHSAKPQRYVTLRNSFPRNYCVLYWLESENEICLS